jgi:hypothetical protein
MLEAMRIVERRAKSGIYLTTNQASVEAMALFAKAGVPLDPIQIYETVELRKIHEIKAAELACSGPPRRISSGCAKFSPPRGAAGRRRGARARGPGLPSGDRERHAEQRLPQGLQRLLPDGRAPPAGLFQGSRARHGARTPSTCRSSTRCCVATAIWRRR